MKNIFLSIVFISLLSACGIIKQVNESITLSKCNFRLKSIEDTHISGINIQNINSISNLKLTDAAKITNSLVSDYLPLDFTLNIEAKNPNTREAAVNKLEWILFIDNIKLANGISNKKIIIPPNGCTSTIPLKIHTNLKKVFTKKTTNAILNFAFNVAGIGNKPTSVVLKAKPSIIVFNTPLTYPDYINITYKFSSK